MYTSGFLCALGLFAVLQVPGAWGAHNGVSQVLNGDDQYSILDKHNTLRANVKPSASNMLEMTWHSGAAMNAQYWANQCLVKHSEASLRMLEDGTVCGENLFMSTRDTPWDDAIQTWYNEVKHWKYGVGAVLKEVVGHYTQLVWSNSHQLGCAKAYCKDTFYKYFYVCHYCPQGNQQLERPYELGDYCSSCPKSCSKKRLCNKPCPFYDKFSNCGDFHHYCYWSYFANLCPGTCKCHG